MRGLLVILCMLVCLVTLFLGGCAGGTLAFERFDPNALAIVVLSTLALVANVWLIVLSLRGRSLPPAPIGPLIAFADLACFFLMGLARFHLPGLLLTLFVPKGFFALHTLSGRPAADQHAGGSGDGTVGGGGD